MTECRVPAPHALDKSDLSGPLAIRRPERNAVLSEHSLHIQVGDDILKPFISVGLAFGIKGLKACGKDDRIRFADMRDILLIQGDGVFGAFFLTQRAAFIFEEKALIFADRIKRNMAFGVSPQYRARFRTFFKADTASGTFFLHNKKWLESCAVYCVYRAF
jgi:hypothetical protein